MGGQAPWDNSGRDSHTMYTMYLGNPDKNTADADVWSWHPLRMVRVQIMLSSSLRTCSSSYF